MRILHCAGRPFLPFTYFYGASRSAGAILRRLRRGGHPCEVVSLIPRESYRWEDGRVLSEARRPRLPDGVATYVQDGITVFAARTRPQYVSLLWDRLTAGRPDALWTELEYSDVAVRLARVLRVPSIVWVKDLAYEHKSAPGMADRTLCATEHARRAVERRWGRPVDVVPEAVDPALYRAPAGRREFLTMVNPVAVKGGGIFRALARRLPGRRFLAVRGWPLPGEDGGTPPPNVTTWPPQEDMRRVYARTKVLLVPSLWEEAFGRVIVEAMLNGIPVIASRVGGIPEVLGGAGLLVRGFRDPAVWARAVERLLGDPVLYARLSRAGRSRARRWSDRAAAARLLAVAREAATIKG